MEQLSLFGEMEGRPPLPPPHLERDVLFYALLLGPQLWLPVSRLVTAQREQHGLTGRMCPTDTFHISVLGFDFADQVDGDDIGLATSIAARTRFHPFEMSFSQLASVGGRRKSDDAALLLTAGGGSDQILGLATRLTSSMIGHGMRPRPFQPPQPHLTLLYDAVRVPPTDLNPPLTVEVNAFSLIHSHRGQSRYSVLWSSA